MEDSSLGSRRSRPESSSSRETRMTPTSSNNSSAAHLPRSHNARVASGASLLQERLRERKVESARQNRRRSVDLGAGNTQSSPIKAHMLREERRPSSSGVGAGKGKGMGVKQIEEQLSTLHKQNFDLKLELYHRRQRQEALEARLATAEKAISETQDINEQLVAELEKRDQAVEEAVGVIVSLEDKVERLMQDREAVQAFDADYEPGYFRDTHELSSSPPEKPSRLRVDTRAIPRMPSFLSEQSEGTEALRSLYLPHNQSHSDATLPKLLEETGTDIPDSPRLSVLSESSFMSVYGNKQIIPSSDELDAEIESPARTHRKSLSVEKWIDERPVQNPTPSKSARAESIRKNGFLSINDVLESPLQKLEKLKHNLDKHNAGHALQRERSHTLEDDERLRVHDKHKTKELQHRGFTDKSSFEHYQTLPPTPDTISTSTLTHHQRSSDALGLEGHTNERLFLNTTSAFPVPDHSYNAYQSTVSVRPRSAGETVTSRRDGHGWDTQEDLTETASLSSTVSISGYSSKPQAKGVMPPNLFTFNDIANRDEMSNWGQDLIFSEQPTLPAHSTHRYDRLRRSSIAEHPHSDSTVIPHRTSQYNDQTHPGISPLDVSPRPNLPDRRSSLSANIKLRKAHPTRYLNDSPRTTASSPISRDQQQVPAESKKSRLIIPRLFTRSESTPPILAQQRPKGTGRSLSYIDGMQPHEVDGARATPPPIKRNRVAQPYRPCSAGEGAVTRVRRGSASLATFDGAVDEGVGGVDGRVDGVSSGVGENGKNITPRKWLGFGRTGSLRRA